MEKSKFKTCQFCEREIAITVVRCVHCGANNLFKLGGLKYLGETFLKLLIILFVVCLAIVWFSDGLYPNSPSADAYESAASFGLPSCGSAQAISLAKYELNEAIQKRKYALMSQGFMTDDDEVIDISQATDDHFEQESKTLFCTGVAESEKTPKVSVHYSLRALNDGTILTKVTK